MGWPGPLTHRQFLVWGHWLDGEWNRPDRGDKYLQQVAYEVRRGNAKHPNRVKFEHLELKFRRRGERPNNLTREQAARISKAKWIGMVSTPGLPVVHVTRKLEDPPPEMTSDGST